jgi:hypothetical protein
MKRRTDVERFLDRDGRLTVWPSRQDARQTVLEYLAAKFNVERDYSEREVNDLLDHWHRFGDHPLLRRALCDAGLLARLDDGSRYWRTATA